MIGLTGLKMNNRPDWPEKTNDRPDWPEKQMIGWTDLKLNKRPVRPEKRMKGWVSLEKQNKKGLIQQQTNDRPLERKTDTHLLLIYNSGT